MATRARSKTSGVTRRKSATVAQPDAWVWGEYEAELPQSEHEKSVIKMLDTRVLSPETEKLLAHFGTNGSPRKPSLIGPFYGLSLIVCLAAIFLLSNTVIKLHSYHMASLENICGDTPVVTGDAMTFINRSVDREKCLMGHGSLDVDIVSNIKSLIEAVKASN